MQSYLKTSVLAVPTPYGSKMYVSMIERGVPFDTKSGRRIILSSLNVDPSGFGPTTSASIDWFYLLITTYSHSHDPSDI